MPLEASGSLSANCNPTYTCTALLTRCNTRAALLTRRKIRAAVGNCNSIHNTTEKNQIKKHISLERILKVDTKQIFEKIGNITTKSMLGLVDVLMSQHMIGKFVPFRYGGLGCYQTLD